MKVTTPLRETSTGFCDIKWQRVLGSMAGTLILDKPAQGKQHCLFVPICEARLAAKQSGQGAWKWRYPHWDSSFLPTESDMACSESDLAGHNGFDMFMKISSYAKALKI
ncbi:hypothetical protein Bbelb_368110 [Branchiostoma belcheri]|nr:hypothetical protein Bbelb_368110 [Branchiostoma belcheri]